MSVENLCQLAEAESIEAQRHLMKVSAMIENILRNWRVERTLVKGNEQAMVDVWYQRHLAKYKFLQQKLKGLIETYQNQVQQTPQNGMDVIKDEQMNNTQVSATSSENNSQPCNQTVEVTVMERTTTVHITISQE